MNPHYHQQPSEELCAMAGLLDPFNGSVDPDFDDGLEELERQFAELRLAFDHH